MSSPAERTLAVWCPDWPVVVARRDDPTRVDQPVVVLEPGPHGRVVRAASSEARAEGVRRGLRRREAEARCPGLVVLDADLAAEARAFEVVARATEAITPGIVLDRPGTLTFPTRGPSRYFGGDDGLCGRVLDAVTTAGVPEARVGVADGPFAARLAARAASPCGARVVDPGETPAFLAPWPVAVLEADDLTALLTELGLWSLGDFAALPGAAVVARFGPTGARAHRLAQGLDEHVAPPTPPPLELVETCELDPPATRCEEAAFATKGLADRLLERLAARGLTCTQVVVEAETEHGERLTRRWRHEGALTSTALVTRVRWQLDGWLSGRTELDDEATAGLTVVRLLPDQLIPATGRQLGFWGGDAAAGDRADRVIARLQAAHGPDAVVAVVPCGGRTPAERVRWVPWGEPRGDDLGPEQPTWPGAVPGPVPTRVFEPRLPVALLDRDGSPVTVSGRGEASADPARLVGGPLGTATVVAWAGPWAQDVRWWDRVCRRRRAVWQLVARGDTTDVACLVVVEAGQAGLEAIYD
ncbi:MAG TPA: DNA polymerase Y family protein [Acidimicrobiia bacterium]